MFARKRNVSGEENKRTILNSYEMYITDTVQHGTFTIGWVSNTCTCDFFQCRLSYF